MCKKEFNEWITIFLESKELDEWFIINSHGWERILNIRGVINILTNHCSYQARKMIKVLLEKQNSKVEIKAILNTFITGYYDAKMGIC